MALTMNLTAKHIALNAIRTDLNGATLTVRTGAPPGAANTATGTVLATATLPESGAYDAASGGEIDLAATLTDSAADASGLAGHFRIVAVSGAVYEGTCGAIGSGADMEFVNPNLLVGNPLDITSCAFDTSN